MPASQINTHRSQQIDKLRRKNQLLEQQLQIKNQQIDDLNFQLRNLHKEQSIWEHLGKSDDKIQNQKQHQRIVEQNRNLIRQVSNLITQGEYKDRTIDELRQKISDMKYHNEQLKKISRKSQQIYEKQIEMLKKGSNNKSSDQMFRLKQQNQKLQNKMNKCAQIVKQTEQFYVNQLNILNQHQQEQKSVIQRLQRDIQYKDNTISDLSKSIHDLNQQINTNKQNQLHKKLPKDKWDDNQNIQELITRQNIQKRWELALSQMKDRYQRQITQLKDNIKFLILKLESVQDVGYQHNKRNSFDNNSNIFGSSSSSLLAQSKIMINSSQSNDSFRFTPNNSFSSSIKQSLSRRQSGAARTPNKQKSSRYSNNHIGALLDRTNI